MKRSSAGLTVLLLLVTSTAGATGEEEIEISAPILPDITIIYPAQGEDFPTTLVAEAQLMSDASLLFGDLLQDCATNPAYAGQYAGITLQSPSGPDLTPDQINTNYDLVARCSYEQHSAKPYWIPQLVSDVDICAEKYGVGWRLISEQDIETFSESDFQFLHDTLAGVNADFTSFYFGLKVFVRGNDGTLKIGLLDPGIPPPRVTPLPADINSDGVVTENDFKYHFEAGGGAGLRCIPRTPSGGGGAGGGGAGGAGAGGAGG